jgi:hypothetical protein
MTQQRRLRGIPGVVVIGDGGAAFDTSAEVAAIIQANTALTTPSLIWEMTCPAQQMIRWGSGSPNQQRNQGYMHFFALDVGTDFEEGTLRLMVTNARRTRSVMVYEVNTQRLHTTTATTAITATPTDINTMVALPEQLGSPMVREDSFLQLWFQTRIPGTTVDACEFSIPVTIYQ